jgi:carbonic anhydrase/acetyltransferase-like protein (isoleucine patch superfamily)
MRKLRRASFMVIFHLSRLVLKGVDSLSPRLYMRLMIPLLRVAGMRFSGAPRYISTGVKFDDFSMIKLGHRVVISDRVILLTHDYSITTALVALDEQPDADVAVRKAITVGDNVFIGMGAMLMPGANVGSNVIIGAGTVVRGIVPSNTLWLGNPGAAAGTVTDLATRWKPRLATDDVMRD